MKETIARSLKGVHLGDAEVYAVDPVCRMTIERNGAKRHNHKGTKYYFCSNNCKTHFRLNPDMYAEPSGEV